MGRPMDCAAAIIGAGGAMTVIDGKGRAWIYNAGADEKGPQAFDAAFVNGNNLVVISGDVPWNFNLVDGTWKEGVKLEVKEGQEDEAWQEAGDVTSAKAPEEPPEVIPTTRSRSKAKADA